MINKDAGGGDIELMDSPPLRKTLGSGQLQNNCPLFVWGNPGNFMKSVIRQRNSIFFVLVRGYCDEAGNQNESLASFLM